MKNSAHWTDTARLRNKLAEFRREEDGSMVYFGLFIVLLMMLLGGIGVDMMNAEMKRTKLQDTLDSAVLAAASLEQELPAEDVVRDYFEKSDLSEHLRDITIEEGIGYKSVTATADTTMATQFMKLAGVDALTLSAAGTAEESIGGVEISLVLDVSGSMASNSRLSNLKVAAKDFVTTLTNTTEDGKLSISIVPYATQVTAPVELFQHMNTDEAHAYSQCVNFDSADFDTVAIDHEATLEQTLHFDIWNYADTRSSETPLTDTVCVNEDSRLIQVLQKDETDLHTFIDSMYADGNTSLDLGMKWGTALLDPSMQPVIETMVNDGDINSQFIERPWGYDSGETLKVVVLMTDGENTSQYYIEDAFRSGISNVYWNESAQRYSIYIGADSGDEDGDGDLTEPMFFWPDVNELGENVSEWQDHPFGGLEGDTETSTYEDIEITTVEEEVCTSYRRNGSCRRYETIEVESESVVVNVSETPHSVALTYPELWAFTSLAENVAEHYVPWMNSDSAYDDWYYDVYDYVSYSTKDSRTLDVCDAAKEAGIIVFTIGFEAPLDGQIILQQCASSDSHYYDVDGLEISDAFAAIASSIRQLRLVQ